MTHMKMAPRDMMMKTLSCLAEMKEAIKLYEENKHLDNKN